MFSSMLCELFINFFGTVTAFSGARNTLVGEHVQGQDTVKAARALKEKFDDLMALAVREVQTANAHDMRFRISSFVKDERKLPNDVIENHLCRIEDYVEPAAILNYLFRHHFIGYINYALIKVVQKVINKKILDEHIEEYKKDYRLFLQYTLKDIHDAFKKCPDLQPDYPVGLPKLTIHLESVWNGRSMYEWKEVLESRWSDWPENLIIERISENCIIITYSVWPKLASDVVKDLTDLVISDLKKEGVSIDISDQLFAFKYRNSAATFKKVCFLFF